ncbi:MAG: hypothetical protein JW717_06240 [Marinilabiliaceae bacterium]|nr:hypothetical protein [Marinilabiliaceae bacterium]
MPQGLFIGLNTIDIQFLVDHYPHENQKAKASNYGLYAGGPATNAAITFAHLKGQSHLVSSFGKHPITHLTYEDLNQKNIKTTDLTPDRSCHPIFASVITTKSTGKRAIVSYHPNYHNYCDITLDTFSVDEFDIVLTDSFYIDAALTLLKKIDNKKPVVLDGGSWKTGLDKLLPYINIAICSNDFHPPGIKNNDEIINFLHSKGISKVAITHGSKPIIISENNSRSFIDVEKIEAVDTLGAGDIFHGAFCFYYAQSNSFIDSLKNASIIAAKSCLHFGTRSWMIKH